jgi:AbrB family looped-hinge helix DNA binding protein
MNATLTSKGQITVPVKIRNQLGLQAGDRLDFQYKEGKVEITKVTGSLDSFIGALPKAKRSFTTEQMNEAIAAGASE